MANSKHRKDHKKKLMARKNRIQQDKNRLEKIKKNFIMELIKKEQEKGLYKDNLSIPAPGQSPNDQIITGPSI